MFDLLENIEKTAEAYGTEKRGKHSWGSSTAKTRLAAADDIVKCVKNTMKFQVVKEMKARDDLHMPAFIDKRVEAKRKLMNASELAKECHVNGWTELSSVKKTDVAAKSEVKEKSKCTVEMKPADPQKEDRQAFFAGTVIWHHPIPSLVRFAVN